MKSVAGVIGLLLFLAGCAAPREAAGPTEAARAVAKEAEKAGDFDMAATMLGGLRVQDRADRTTRLEEVRLLMLAGRLDEAEARLREILALGPNPTAARQLANLHLARGDAGQALQVVDAQAYAADPLMLNTRGVAFDTLGRSSEAQQSYRTSLRLAPNDPTVTANLAVSLMLTGQTEEALRIVATLDPGRVAEEHREWDVALVQVAGGRRDMARLTLERAGHQDAVDADMIRLERIMALPASQRRAALNLAPQT